MKNIIYFAILFGIILVLPSLHGCGRGEDETTKVVTAPEDTQTVVEQKAELPADSNETISQTAETTEVTEKISTMQEIADVITIENQGYTSDKKGPVNFSHLKHNKEYEINCVQCHHLYKDGQNLWKEGDNVDKCVVCHDPAEEKDEVIKLQSAFHKNCKDCHSEANKEGKEAPSTKCTECHG